MIFDKVLILITSVVLAIVVSFGVWQFYKTKRAQYSSKNYPIIFIVSAALGGLLLIVSVWPILLNFIINLINDNFGTEIRGQSYNDLSSLAAYTLFCCLLGWLGYNHYKHFGRLEFLGTTSHITVKDKQERIIDIPESTISISSVFRERVHDFFALRYPEIEMTLAEDHEMIIGEYRFGGRRYVKIISLISSDGPKEISRNLTKESFYNIKKFTNRNDYYKEYLIDNIVIVEKGYYSPEKELPVPQRIESETYTIIPEEYLVETYIDFRPYLRSLVDDFENSTLPFSFSFSADNARLETTYIQPSYNGGKGLIKEYVDTWLSTKSHEQIALLGQYGTGKTSFVKFYSRNLANSVLQEKLHSQRIPVFISLTSTSPMHSGIDSSIKSFIVDSKIDISVELFNYVTALGKFVFLLDGFDEMGYIGTHDQRFYQLNAIWKLATVGNKIIITGRQSYFPTELEENNALNVKSQEDLLFPQERAYTKKLSIDFFNDDQITESLLLYYEDKHIAESYANFIFSNESLHELCRRPSLMHIVREILPQLIIDQVDDQKQLSSSDLMSRYVSHWIERQLGKNITSSFVHGDKQNIIIDFYTQLAGFVYADARLNSVVPLSLVRLMCKYINEQYKINSPEAQDGLETEILTAYFLERLNDEYKFVHKSFYEYFVAKNIVEKLVSGDVDDFMFKGRIWSNEIIDYVYDSKEINSNRKIKVSNVPLLLTLTNSKLIASLKSYVFKGLASYYFNVKYNYILQLFLYISLAGVAVWSGFHVREIIDSIVMPNSLNLLSLLVVAAASLLLVVAMFVLEATWVLSIITLVLFLLNLKVNSVVVTMSISFLCLYYMNALYVRSFSIITELKNRAGVFLFLFSFVFHIALSTLVFHYHSRNIYSILSMIVFYTSLMLSLSALKRLREKIFFDDIMIERLPLDFVLQAFYVSIKKNIVYQTYPLYIYHFNDAINIQKVETINDSNIEEKYSRIELSNVSLDNVRIHGASISLTNCQLRNVKFIGKPLAVSFDSCVLNEVKFDFSVNDSRYMGLLIEKMSHVDLDESTLVNLKDFINSNPNLECLKHLPDWITDLSPNSVASVNPPD